MKKLKLRNAMQLSVELEEFNSIDFEKEYKTLKIGDTVKVCRETNFFWVVIKEIVNFQYIIGTLNIGLGIYLDVNYGDEIEFSFENIYDIIKTEELSTNNTLGEFVFNETFGSGVFNICICGKM